MAMEWEGSPVVCVGLIHLCIYLLVQEASAGLVLAVKEDSSDPTTSSLLVTPSNFVSTQVSFPDWVRGDVYNG